MELPYKFKAAELIKEGRTSQKALDEIKSWLAEQGEIQEKKQVPLPKQVPDELLVLFLLSCDNAIEATKTTITTFFKIKSSAPEMFDDRDIDREDLQKAMKTVFFVSMPERMEGNDVIHFFKVHDTSYSNFELIPLMKIAFMLVDISQRENPPVGLVVVIDMKGIGFMHLTKFRLGPLKTFFQFLQEGMQLKIRTIHIINANYVLNKILLMIKAFMKTELVDMLQIHPQGFDLEAFHKNHIPVKCLPKEYGGDLASTEELNGATIQHFQNLKPFFEAEEKLRHKAII